MLIDKNITWSGSINVVDQLPAPPTPNLWLWGANDYGGLGTNDTANRSSPTQVGVGTNWSRVSSGRYTTMAIKTDGTLWGWGFNNHGQLGLNDTVYASPSPTQVGALTTWSKVSAGSQITAAIKTDGTLWLWGRNNYGQLGTNDLANRSSPTQVGVATNWSLVSTGTYSTIAVKTDGTLWLWGYNNNGQLGQNDRVYRSSPTQVGSATTWSRVSMGRYAAAAITTN